MRTIQKQISLEPMTSRLPSVWPAYYDNVYYYFDDETVVCDGCEESFDVSNLKFVPPFVEVHEYEIR